MSSTESTPQAGFALLNELADTEISAGDLEIDVS